MKRLSIDLDAAWWCWWWWCWWFLFVFLLHLAGFKFQLFLLIAIYIQPIWPFEHEQHLFARECLLVCSSSFIRSMVFFGYQYCWNGALTIITSIFPFPIFNCFCFLVFDVDWWQLNHWIVMNNQNGNGIGLAQTFSTIVNLSSFF